MNRLKTLRPLPNDLPYNEWVNKVILERENRMKVSVKKQRSTKVKFENVMEKTVEKMPEYDLDKLIQMLEERKKKC